MRRSMWLALPGAWAWRAMCPNLYLRTYVVAPSSCRGGVLTAVWPQFEVSAVQSGRGSGELARTTGTALGVCIFSVYLYKLRTGTAEVLEYTILTM